MSTSIPDRSITPGPGPLRPFDFPPIDRFALGNGLPVLFAPTGGLPVTTFTLLLPAGALREAPEARGLATLTGALLESGARDLTAYEIAERIESIGVRIGVGTSWEVSHLQVTALTERLGEAVELIGELVRAPTFPETEFERLKEQQLAGIVQRRADPRGLANEFASYYIFGPESPFARPITGIPTTVGPLTRERVADFHQSSYTPRQGSLIAAGSASAEQLRMIGEECFGDWQGPEPLPLPDAESARADSVRILLLARPGAVQSEIRIGHLGVARNTPDYFPLLVMNTILGGAFSSRLNLNLREKHGFTYGASSRFVMRKWPGPFLVSTAVQTEVTGAAVREIMTEIERMRDTPVTAAELNNARQYVAGTFPLALQTTDGVASRLADLAIHDLPDRFLYEFAERVLAVGAEEIMTVARSHLHPKQVMILVVGDPEVVRPQLDSLQLGAVEVVEIEAAA